ncbi:MAG TPA: transposase [Chthoniobacterales bacterium]
MARPLRLDIEGGWYHVINRGLEKKQIFPDERANTHFINLLSALPTRFALKIHTYVLMGNHYHLQIETPKANLSQAMQWLNVSYSTWFNRLHRRSGPLFQGRFKAVLHDQDGSALTINRYIHLNPVRVATLGGHEGRAAIGQTQPDPEMIKARAAALNYPWSSYNVYVGNEKNPGWLTTDFIYTFLDKHSLRSLRLAYRRELEQMAALGDWETDWKNKISASLLLGSDSFVRQMARQLKGNRQEQRGLRQSERIGPDWKSTCTAVSKVWKEDWETLTARRGNGALHGAWYLARNFAGMRLAELGSASGGTGYSAVSMAISRFEKRLQVDRDLQRRIKAVRKILML